MHPITHQQWRLIGAVVEAGGLSAAARRLGISGPSASRTVRTIEARLGVPLSDRVGRTLRPTRSRARVRGGRRAGPDVDGTN